MSPWRRWWRDRFFTASDHLCSRRLTFGFGNWLGEIGWRIGCDREGRPVR